MIIIQRLRTDWNNMERLLAFQLQCKRFPVIGNGNTLSPQGNSLALI